MKIKRWIRDGEDALGAQGIENTEELLCAAGRKLDKAYAHDIVGECLFEGEDGKYYVGTVEFVIEEANPGYVEDCLEIYEATEESA